MNPNYTLITGFHNNLGAPMDWFYNLWWHNLHKYARPIPRQVITLASAGQFPFSRYGTWLSLSGDLGACGELLAGKTKYYMPGCPAVWMAGMWLAYINQTDFLYREQDVLCFGPWIERMYEDLGDAGMVVHGKNKTHGASTSLFLIRHEFIPAFCQLYLADGPETHPNRIAELKMGRLSSQWPELFRNLSFGVDTDRPLPVSDPVWYAQKFTPAELHYLETMGQLISCYGIPDVPTFSNH